MPFVETAPLVGRSPNNPHQAAGRVTLPHAVSMSVLTMVGRKRKRTVSANGRIKPGVGSNSGRAARAAAAGRLVSVRTGVPRRLIVDVFRGFLPVSKGGHLGLSHDRDALVEQFLNAVCRPHFERVRVVKSSVALRDPGTFEMDVVLDHDSDSSKW